MEHSPSTRLLEHSIWRQLERVQQITGWEDALLADKLGYTHREFLKNRARRRPLTASAMLALADELKLNVIDLALGKIDFVALERHFHGQNLYLPDRYSAGAFSRRRTSLHFIGYCDEKFGASFTDRILNKLQLKRAVFSEPELLISIRFLADACAEVAKSPELQTSPETFIEIGRHSAVVNSSSELASALRSCATVRDAYDLQINHRMNTFDQNCSYRTIELSNQRCVIESRQREEACDRLQLPKIGSALTCLTRVGVASSFTRLLGLPYARVVETHCVHRGDAACRFEVDYESAATAQRKEKIKNGRSFSLLTTPLSSPT